MDWVITLRYLLLAVMLCLSLLCLCYARYRNSSMKLLLHGNNERIRRGSHRQYQLLSKYSQSTSNHFISSSYTKPSMASYEKLGNSDKKITPLMRSSNSNDGYLDTTAHNKDIIEEHSKYNIVHEDMDGTFRRLLYSLNESDRNYHNTSALHYFFSQTEYTTLAAIERIISDTVNVDTWNVVNRVGQLQPFFLFDQRGAASRAVRKAVHKACEHRRIPYFIPCFSHGVKAPFTAKSNSTEDNSSFLNNASDVAGRLNNTNCESYSIPRKTGKVVHVFYMQWGEQNNLERFKGRSRSSFSCASNFREPLMRVQSCLYEKHSEALKALKVRCISELTVEQLLDLLVRRGIDDAGSTCLNEPFRAFSGVNDEEVLGQLGFSLIPDGYIDNRLNALDVDIFNFTVQHLLKCAPFIVDAPYRRNSLRLLMHKFPSLASQQLFDFEFSSGIDYHAVSTQTKRNTTWDRQHHPLYRFSASRSPFMEDADKNINPASNADKAEKLLRKRSPVHRNDNANKKRQLKGKAISYHSSAAASVDKGTHCKNYVLSPEHATLLQRVTALEKVLFDVVKFRINSASLLLE